MTLSKYAFNCKNQKEYFQSPPPSILGTEKETIGEGNESLVQIGYPYEGVDFHRLPSLSVTDPIPSPSLSYLSLS